MKFLVDAMLGKLARFLRIFGYDTIYADDLEDYFKIKPVPDDKLLEYAKKTKRIIITRDLPFHNNAKNSIYLEGRGIYNYLAQLKEKSDLEFDFNLQKARCSICNSEIKKISKAKAKQFVKPKVLKFIDHFYQCSNPDCHKVFWKGSHIDNIAKKLKNIQ